MSRYHEPHSYVARNNRNGWDARCYAVRADNWNAIGTMVDESSHRTLAAAIKAAKRFHKIYGGTIQLPET